MIASVSSRLYAELAFKAGYNVVCLDIFSDLDVRQYANKVVKLNYSHHGFESGSFIQAIQALGLPPTTQFIFGSGFEAAPALLDEVSGYLHVLGNHSTVIRQAKSWSNLRTILNEENICFPATISNDIPFPIQGLTADAWLHKSSVGSGGVHVRSWVEGVPLQENEYLQAHLQGEPISVVFLACGSNVLILGVNRLFTQAYYDEASGVMYPYQYAGLVTNISVDPSVLKQLVGMAQALSARLDLKGLNSIDAMLVGDDVYFLEVNPRLSASVYGYDTPSFSVIDAHLQACKGTLPQAPKEAFGNVLIRVIFAEQDCTIPFDITWPCGITDIPPSGTTIRQGKPVCSIVSRANRAKDAHKNAEKIRVQLEIFLHSFTTE